MKINGILPSKIAVTCGLHVILCGFLYGQGGLDPRERPAPTMKSLQQIWDKIETLEGKVSGLEGQLSDLRTFLGAPPTIEMVPVGNAGNDADTTVASDGTSGYGAVDYEYKIGKYEVTNAQYAQFLNAVAATDTNNVYNTNMSGARNGITRSGASGSYTYAVKSFMGDKPINRVNWYSALRFCNWLHNGRPTGAQGNSTTERGAYTLTDMTTITLPGSDPIHGANGRNADARFWLPSEDEWYKAAYHDPVNSGADAGGTADYWLYPTKSDSPPTLATADLDGNIDNDIANIANYNFGADWNGLDGNVTTVGSGGSGSATFYGACDMGGNLFEFNEQVISGNRGMRGGSWSLDSNFLQSSLRGMVNPDASTTGNSSHGFRVAGR